VQEKGLCERKKDYVKKKGLCERKKDYVKVERMTERKLKTTCGWARRR
jgi:hypothetical protein